MKEKDKIIIHRVSWLWIVIFILFIPIIINRVKPKLDIVDDEGYVNEYYSHINRTDVTIYITFNREVNSGYATVKYYDSANNLLETKRSYFTAYGEKIAESYLIGINGEVASYEIESFEFNTAFTGGWIYLFMLPAGIMLISSLFLKYKEYSYADKKISIYLGWYHHTLRVNGKKYDEYNTIMTTIMTFRPLRLSTTLDDGTKIEAKISATNKIFLKINDKLFYK